MSTSGKGRTSWDAQLTEDFIDICLEVIKKERCGGSFTKKGWQDVLEVFKEKTEREWDINQLKNKWVNMRKEWIAWSKLFLYETGLGWNPFKQNVTASDKWWEEKIQGNPEYRKYRYKSLPIFPKLTDLFKGGVATGEFQWTPNSGILPTNPYDEDEDVYRPTFNQADLEEGSGDSDEILGEGAAGTSAGISSEMRNINITTSDGSNRSAGKRKRDGSGHGKKKKKGLNSSDVISALSRIADNNERRLNLMMDGQTTVDPTQTPTLTIPEAIDVLDTIPAVQSDEEFYMKCCTLMMSEPHREVLRGLRNKERILVKWLRDQCFGQ